MLKPVIMSVDDEPVVLKAVGRDLHAHYQRDYQILEVGSAVEALEMVLKLKQRNTPIALFLVDQRMPEMSGTEFLARAVRFYPEAKKVLLTAYADTEAAIESINAIGLDFYLLKPWDPPEEKLYPLLDDLLSDWVATMRVPFDGIRVVGAMWSISSHETKDFLTRNQIPYQWLDIEKDREAKVLVESVEGGEDNLPLVFFPDGSILIEPEPKELADKVGLKTEPTNPFYDLIIVGGGPAGLGAAVYSGSEGLKTLMIESEAVGGQAGTSSRIENYLGFPNGISGSELARRATSQAKKFGVEILTAQQVVKVEVEDPYRLVTLSDGTQLSCHALLIATGVNTRKLDLPGVEGLYGKGIYYGASLAEAIAYKDQEVFIVGGANSAGQAALFFARYAKKVTILSRSTTLSRSMSAYLVKQIVGVENIEVLDQSEVVQVSGTDQLEAITFTNKQTGETQTREAAALFIFIGAVPRSDLVEDVVERDRVGFILTGQDLVEDGKRPQGWKPQRDPFLLETSVPGIFAAGDVRHGSVKRVATAVGEGATAVKLIHQHLRTV
ncbi:MAG: FAD-dependent oxidoreductase [Anaerolineales bacterium]